jgi:hypothetical protein
MDTLLIVFGLAAFAAARLFAGKLAGDFIQSLPAQERDGIQGFLAFSA